MNERPRATLAPVAVLVPAPRRDRLERAEPVAGQRRYSTERDRAGAGPVGGGATAQPRHRHDHLLAAVTRKGHRGYRGDALGLPVEIDDGPARGCLRRAGRASRMTDWFADWVAGAFTPEGRRNALPTCAAERSPRSIARSPAAGGAGGGARRAVPSVARRDGARTNVRTRNAVPVWCEPPANGKDVWGITYADYQIAWHAARQRASCASSRAPAAGECGSDPAAEGATGPRKRSGKQDRDGQGSLESRIARKRGVRTDGVRGRNPRISQVP